MYQAVLWLSFHRYLTVVERLPDDIQKLTSSNYICDGWKISFPHHQYSKNLPHLRIEGNHHHPTLTAPPILMQL
jgi:hypothetical protein